MAGVHNAGVAGSEKLAPKFQKAGHSGKYVAELESLQGGLEETPGEWGCWSSEPST